MSELPPGFVLDEPDNSGLPPGFVLDGEAPTDLASDSPGYTGSRAAAGIASATSTVPFYDEYTGVVNAVASALYNTPGAIKDVTDGKGFGRYRAVPKAYDEQVKAQRGIVKFGDEKFPNQSAAIKGTAFGLQGVGAARALPLMAPADGSSQVANFARQAAASGAEGGLTSAVYGFAEGEGGLENRMDMATEYGKMGVLLGAPLGVAVKGIVNKLDTGSFIPKSGERQILEMTRQQLNVSNSSVNSLRGVLKSGGYSGKDIDAGIVSVVGRLQSAPKTGDRAGLFALELQKEFPAARQQITDVFQQLMTAPPKQGRTGQMLTEALDDQSGSQGTFFDRVAQEKLGSSSVKMEQNILERQRAEIGEIRDRVIKFAATDARGKGVQREMTAWLDDFANDREVMGSMRAAARELGFKGNKEVADAMASNPALLMQKFGEISGAQIRSPRGASPVLQRARQESENMFDELSRYTRQDANHAFAPKDTGEIGPYKRQQGKFRESYTQEETITEARGKFAQARDPVKADEFVEWVHGLPQGEQALVKTVIRQDMEKMLRGGNIDQDGAYLTNLKKSGVHDVLTRVLGKDGEDISKAIRQLVDEQEGLKLLDPRKGMQSRVVKPDSKAYRDAVDLYSTGLGGEIAKLGNKLPAMGGYAGDIGLMASGQLPYLTIGKQVAKAFRPRAKTREGLAQILSMREAPAAPSANRGTLSRIPGTGGASAPATNALAPKKPGPTQANKWQPVRLPDAKEAPVASIDTGARQTVAKAQQKLEQAQQKMANAKAARADEETVRKLLVEQKQAEAGAKLAQQQAKAAKKITKSVLNKINTRARELAKENKTSVASERAKLEQRELTRLEAVAAKQDANKAAGELSSAMDSHKQKLAGAKDAADALEMRTKAKQLRVEGQKRANTKMAVTRGKQAAEAARTGVDPADIYDETGILALKFGAGDDVVFLETKDYAKTMAKLQRDILKLKYSDQHTRETKLLEDAFGWDAVRKAAEAGDITGWTTAAQRKAALRAKQAIGTTGAALAGAAAYGKYDERKQARREKAFEAMEQDRDTTKLVQKALKSAGYYKGRNDGKFDTEVSNALITFQRSQGISKPGTLNMKTTKALQNALAEAGKTEEAEALKAATPK